jgi:hypothetical protein
LLSLLLANIHRRASQTRVTVLCNKKLRLHNGSQSQRARSVKIGLRQQSREVNLFFSIHEKNRELVNM